MRRGGGDHTGQCGNRATTGTACHRGQRDCTATCHTDRQDRHGGRGHRGEQQMGGARRAGHCEQTGDCGEHGGEMLSASPAIGSRWARCAIAADIRAVAPAAPATAAVALPWRAEAERVSRQHQGADGGETDGGHRAREPRSTAGIGSSCRAPPTRPAPDRPRGAGGLGTVGSRPGRRRHRYRFAPTSSSQERRAAQRGQPISSSQRRPRRRCHPGCRRWRDQRGDRQRGGQDQVDVVAVGMDADTARTRIGCRHRPLSNWHGLGSLHGSQSWIARLSGFHR